jgi:hypothetical protein
MIGPNITLKNQRPSGRMEKQELIMCCPCETYLTFKGTNRFREKDGKRYTRKTVTKHRAGMAILISDKIILKIRNITRDKRDIS